LEDKNIDGFRLDALKHLIESDQYENEPLRDDYWKHPHLDVNYDDIKHLYTTNQPETFELLLEWKVLFDDISKRTNKIKYFLLDNS
jgi:alpha-glucosidase